VARHNRVVALVEEMLRLQVDSTLPLLAPPK